MQGLIILATISWTAWAVDGFASPRVTIIPFASRSISESQRATTVLSMNSSPSSSLWLAAVDGAISTTATDDAGTATVLPPDAFTDSIDFTGGPVLTIFGVAAVALALLVGFKFLTNNMDVAITQVLLDFESTLKQYYPSTWETIAKELEGLTGEERDIKLLKIMDKMQEDDPKFMLEVRQQMPNF